MGMTGYERSGSGMTQLNNCKGRVVGLIDHMGEHQQGVESRIWRHGKVLSTFHAALPVSP